MRVCASVYIIANSYIKQDAYLVPNIKSILLSLNTQKNFSSFDLMLKGYW